MYYHFLKFESFSNKKRIDYKFIKPEGEIMQKRNYILIPIFLIAVISLICSFMLGVQYLASLFLDFKFTASSGPIFLTLTIFVGFILLTPLSIFLEALIEHIGTLNKGFYLLLQIIQLILFIFLMELILSYFNIVIFSGVYTEYTYYTIMYCFFFVLAKIGDLVKKTDEQSLTMYKGGE